MTDWARCCKVCGIRQRRHRLATPNPGTKQPSKLQDGFVLSSCARQISAASRALRLLARRRAVDVRTPPLVRPGTGLKAGSYAFRAWADRPFCPSNIRAEKVRTVLHRIEVETEPPRRRLRLVFMRPTGFEPVTFCSGERIGPQTGHGEPRKTNASASRTPVRDGTPRGLTAHSTTQRLARGRDAMHRGLRCSFGHLPGRRILRSSAAQGTLQRQPE